MKKSGGGNNELALWAYITQTPIIVTHETLNTYTIYKSDVHTMPEKKQVSTLRSTHLQITRDYSEPVYLIYNGYHYNPIIHARSTKIIPICDMPQWTPPPPPPPRKRIKDGSGAAAAKKTESSKLHTDREHVLNNVRKRNKLGDSTAERTQQKRKADTQVGILDEQEYKSGRRKADETSEN